MSELAGRRIYLLPIGGTGMASLAGLLRAAGAEVAGSDHPLYPPTSTLLEKLGIEVLSPMDAGNLDRIGHPIDEVVIGNAVPRTNVEVEEVIRRGLPYTSMPEGLRKWFLTGRHPVVIAGTHGKTTTSSLVAWLLESAGLQPSFLVGGELQNFGQNFQLGAGEHFVIEGDEYNTAFFDRGAKFLHYAAKTLLVNNVELDHLDLYPDFDAVLAAFRAAVAQVPEGGRIVWNAGDRGARAALERGAGERAPAARPISFTVGPEPADWRTVELPGGAVRFEGPDGAFEATVPDSLAGRHNLSNALAAVAIVAGLGVPPAAIAAGLASFRGVRRRLEVVGTVRGVTVVDDFAHHPTAVRETLAAARRRFAPKRLIALFEPRSLSAGRNTFQEEYGGCFAGADRVILAPIFYAGRLPPGEMLDADRLLEDIRRSGPEPTLAGSIDEVIALAARESGEGDVVLCMSSGSFGGAPGRIVEALGR